MRVARWRASAPAALVLTLSLACSTARPAPERAAAREQAYRANNLGVALLEQLKYPEAAAAFRTALTDDPSLALAHFNLGIALLYAQDYDGAQREVEQAATALPDRPQPRYVLGLIARAQSQNDVARQQFDRVRQLAPTDVGVNINIAQLALEDQRYADAIAALRPVVDAEPSNVTAAYVLGLALTRSGAVEDGQRLLERAQALRRTDYAVTFGTGYLEQGQLAEAIASTGQEPELRLPASARVTFTRTSIGAAPGAPPRSAENGPDTGLTLADVDGDGDLDALVAAGSGLRVWRHDGSSWTDMTADSGLAGVAVDGPAVAVAGDFDNSGSLDLLLTQASASSLYRNDGQGRFTDVSKAAALPPLRTTPSAVAWVDVDHDGDVDVVLAGTTGRVQVLRNNRDGSFTDVSTAAKLAADGHVVAIVPTDYDNHRDVDLLLVFRDRPPMLYANQRDGSFRDVSEAAGLASLVTAGTLVTAVTTGDFNKDDAPDFAVTTKRGLVAAMSDGRGRFTRQVVAEGAADLTAVQALDYDSDGLLDLVGWTVSGPRVWRNEGGSWRDASGMAVPGAAAAGVASPRAVAAGDLDADGFTDLLSLSADGLALWHNSGDPARRGIRIGLRGLVSNKAGVGTKVQVRAGSLSSRLETSAASPAVAPADVVFGLGERPGADVVRLLWPSGILQAEVASTPAAERPASPEAPASGPGAAPATLPAYLAVEELDRKPSSCPFLFTWNGERFEFVTDFLGGGEMGDWVAPGTFNRPDPLEYVRIREDQLRPQDGRLSLRVTNELEETLFLDQVQLMAVAHPAEVEVYPNEGMTDPPKPHRLHTVSGVRAAASVVDDHGHDMAARVAAQDWLAPDDFALAPIRGYAGAHALTIDLGAAARPVLLLTAWTDYAFSSDNVAAQQAGLASELPRLEARTAHGEWRSLPVEIGLPVGRPQTIAVDLSTVLRRGERVLRLSTNMRIYWDRIAVGDATPALRHLQTLDPLRADLRERGFSAELRGDRRRPTLYDYDQVTPFSPWKAMAGRFTRPGDVRPLLAAADDQFVIARPGDEVMFEFNAGALTPLPAGWTRTYLLRADGFSKEMDPNSGSPYTVEPLPFHRMTRYPYDPARERYPETAAFAAYRETYNSRSSHRSLPPLAPVPSQTPVASPAR